MPFTLEEAEHTQYHATDGSDLYFSVRDASQMLTHFTRNPDGLTPDERYKHTPCVKGGPAPTHLTVAYMQYSANGYTATLDLSKLERIRSVNGGIRYRSKDVEHRRGTDYKSHTYHFYLNHGPCEPKILIIVSHGGGVRGYMMYHPNSDETMLAMAKTVDDGTFFDLCDLIVHAFTHGREHGTTATARKYKRAFIEGRLKKVKRKGSYNVEIDSDMEPKIALKPEPEPVLI